MRDRGLRVIHMICDQADNKADVVPVIAYEELI